ncbi:preprotein translocase subunit SecE [Aldersonia sp. NBC_00410]|uniref:preprotein translocase subunit SecE n=1 Tax=Aldersonia sp. NBC_00410 TaxID=2975954 RepID=UPI002253BBA3|nr:preprotein translocase subunit SecE [Aldersonia sp. NBC_00410]MCX5041670.1 preprotein translocase subunit SecE [Aldersonia sp. NBC_00410]
MSDERDTLDGGSDGKRRSAADANGNSESSVNRPSGKRAARRTQEEGSVAVASATPKSKASTAAADKKPKKVKTEGRGNPFKRLRKFLREVVAELRKVIWPNRKQMITYTSVVLVFVVFMVAFISGLDLAFIKGVSWLFG